jgi:hypothetical protein
MGRWAVRITGRLALTLDFILEGIALVAFVYVAPLKGLVVPSVMFAGFPGVPRRCTVIDGAGRSVGAEAFWFARVTADLWAP